MNQKLQDAITAIKAGNRKQGYTLLVEVIKSDPSRKEAEIAWLWMSTVVSDTRKKRQSLETVLKINPENEIALRRLAQLDSLDQTVRTGGDKAGGSARNHYDDEVETKQCPYCAETIKVRAKICRYCGYNLEIEPVSASVESTANITDAEPSTFKKRHQKNILQIIFGVVGIVSVVLIFGVFILWITGFFSSTDSMSSSVSDISLTTEDEASEISETPILAESVVIEAVSTNTLTPAALCQPHAARYLNQIRPLWLEFQDTVNVADSTARIALVSVIQDLQSIRRDVMAISVPNCVQGPSDLIVGGMERIIEAFIDFMGNSSERTVERKMSQGILSLVNGTEQLVALAEGQLTPVPRQLPTHTPIPTPLPTPTPLVGGSLIIIKDNAGNSWEVRVVRVVIADIVQSSYSNNMRRAAGRFAILFVEVTNLGLSSRSIIPFSYLDIEDASGQRYSDNSVAGMYAESMYEDETDRCFEINPGETQTCVGVYDISQSSEFYILVPSRIADAYGSRVFLEIP